MKYILIPEEDFALIKKYAENHCTTLYLTLASCGEGCSELKKEYKRYNKIREKKFPEMERPF